MKQQWTHVVLTMLTAKPMTCAQINATAQVQAMNAQHRRERVHNNSWEKPVNGMVYDTLYRLRKRGLVERDEKGIYRLVTQDEYMYTRGEYEC
jgi:DNA-binding PadR family transcriptional regulator